MSDLSVAGRGLGVLAESLREDKTKINDIKMLVRAAREGWDIPADAKAEAALILLEIARKRSSEVPGADGVVVVANSRNQVAAIHAMAELDRINQIDFWNADKNDRMDAGKATEVYSGIEINIAGRKALP